MWHLFWLWVYYNGQTIQAATGVLALLGLAVYAHDTRQIREATLAQSAAGRRPYFQAEQWKNTDDVDQFKGKEYYQFRNCGSGIALNVCWRFINDPSGSEVQLGSCAVGQVKYPFTAQGHWTEYPEIIKGGGAYLSYADTSGVRYWTTLTVKAMADNTFHD